MQRETTAPLSPLHQRLRAAAGRRSYREIADATNAHPETVRRYLTGHAPSVEFLSMLCMELRVNGEWILTGRGPMHATDAWGQGGQAGGTAHVLNGLARTLQEIEARIARVELYLQLFEARLLRHGRAHSPLSRSAGGEAQSPAISGPSGPSASSTFTRTRRTPRTSG